MLQQQLNKNTRILLQDPSKQLKLPWCAASATAVLLLLHAFQSTPHATDVL
jgi:hypothetical protein